MSIYLSIYYYICIHIYVYVYMYICIVMYIYLYMYPPATCEYSSPCSVPHRGEPETFTFWPAQPKMTEK